MDHTVDGDKHTITFECQCPSCNGTGLYVGYLENQSGIAVVCHTCKGTGRITQKIEFKEFHGKKPRTNINKVVRYNPGLSLGKTLDFGGISYKDWASGKKFPKGSEMRKFVCPAWWYQGVDYSKKPQWEECSGCGSFSGCKMFSQKDKCWNKFDRMNARKLSVAKGKQDE